MFTYYIHDRRTHSRSPLFDMYLYRQTAADLLKTIHRNGLEDSFEVKLVSQNTMRTVLMVRVNRCMRKHMDALKARLQRSNVQIVHVDRDPGMAEWLDMGMDGIDVFYWPMWRLTPPHPSELKEA